ncbi:hypothetical protein NPIL_240291 [Nephila pilipes]|uniref:Uncharacterized protein n=1 Tax=Nephila pilipes TaxID=299642 RepID=A0A8X6JZN4_NEPPI|nr:hypothetical protein NPIL_240291 [Nephila pilipes]
MSRQILLPLFLLQLTLLGNDTSDVGHIPSQVENKRIFDPPRNEFKLSAGLFFFIMRKGETLNARKEIHRVKRRPLSEGPFSRAALSSKDVSQPRRTMTPSNEFMQILERIIACNKKSLLKDQID